MTVAAGLEAALVRILTKLREIARQLLRIHRRELHGREPRRIDEISALPGDELRHARRMTAALDFLADMPRLQSQFRRQGIEQ